MYQFVFGFINITDLSIDVESQVCTTLLVSQLSPFASDLIFVHALIIGLILTSKSQNMVITHLAGQTNVWDGCKWNFAGPQIYLQPAKIKSQHFGVLLKFLVCN